MPRKEQPITHQTPVGQFAEQLRYTKRKAQVTYRQMAAIANYSHVHLTRAARGDRLPTWAATKAFLKGCGIADPELLQKWENYWAAVDFESGRGAVKRKKRHLQYITTVPEYGVHLRSVAMRKGPKTLRELQALTGIGKSTIADWFNGRALPAAEPVYRFAGLLGLSAEEVNDLVATRDRLDRGNNTSSELARTLADLRSVAGTMSKKDARAVGVALVDAERARVVRSDPRPTKPQPAPVPSPPPAVTPSAPLPEPSGRGDIALWTATVQVPGKPKASREAYDVEKVLAAKLANSLLPPIPARHGALVDIETRMDEALAKVREYEMVVHHARGQQVEAEHAAQAAREVAERAMDDAAGAAEKAHMAAALLAEAQMRVNMLKQALEVELSLRIGELAHQAGRKASMAFAESLQAQGGDPGSAGPIT